MAKKKKGDQGGIPDSYLNRLFWNDCTPVFCPVCHTTQVRIGGCEPYCQQEDWNQLGGQLIPRVPFRCEEGHHWHIVFLEDKSAGQVTTFSEDWTEATPRPFNPETLWHPVIIAKMLGGEGAL